jgi:hypothetical protein
VTLDKTLVERIIPDEVPHPDPAPAVVADQDAQAPGQLAQGGRPAADVPAA